MKINSVFFYQAVKLGSAMINSANSERYNITFEDGLCLIEDPKQNITVAVPTTNIPQMTVATVAKERPMTPLEKARMVKAQKREQDANSQD